MSLYGLTQGNLHMFLEVTPLKDSLYKRNLLFDAPDLAPLLLHDNHLFSSATWRQSTMEARPSCFLCALPIAFIVGISFFFLKKKAFQAIFASPLWVGSRLPSVATCHFVPWEITPLLFCHRPRPSRELPLFHLAGWLICLS